MLLEVKQERFSDKRDKDPKLWVIFQKLKLQEKEMAKRDTSIFANSLVEILCSSSRYPSTWTLLTETKVAVLSEKVEFTFQEIWA